MNKDRSQVEKRQTTKRVAPSAAAEARRAKRRADAVAVPEELVEGASEGTGKEPLNNQAASFSEHEMNTMKRLPKALRAKLRFALNLPALYESEADLRRGENSHWVKKRENKHYSMYPSTTPSKARRVTLEEAVNELSCSADYLKKLLDGPKVMGKRPKYEEAMPDGVIMVVTKVVDA